MPHLPREDVSASAATALAELHDAYSVTRRHRWPIWEFAVGIDRLLQKGLSETELRTLVRLGALEHALETTKPSRPSRTFRRVRSLVVGSRSCFVLTEVGAKMLARIHGRGHDLITSAMKNGRAKSPSIIPHWDGEERKLFFRGETIRLFPRAAPCQEEILAAFQAGNWQHRVVLSWPDRRTKAAHRRTHDAIKRLNQSVKGKGMRF